VITLGESRAVFSGIANFQTIYGVVECDNDGLCLNARANFGVADPRHSKDSYLPKEREPLLRLCIRELRRRFCQINAHL